MSQQNPQLIRPPLQKHAAQMHEALGNRLLARLADLDAPEDVFTLAHCLSFMGFYAQEGLAPELTASMNADYLQMLAESVEVLP